MVSPETLSRLSEHTLRENDIVFGRKGSIDRHAFIDKRYNGWMQGSDCIRVRIHASDVNPRFISHYLKLESVKKQLMNGAVGSTMPSMNTDILKSISISMPNITTQDAIESLVSSIEETIENNKTICSDLEAMAKLLYDYWFVQFDFPDVNGKPYKSSGGKMVWNEELKREIPEGWEVKTLPDVVSLRYGYPLSTEVFGDNGIGVVRIRDIADNSISALTTEVVSEEYFTQEGDLLVGMDGNFQMNYWIRNGDIVNQRITRIRKKSLPIMIIKMQIEPYITAKITNVARSTVGHLGDGDFKRQKIVIPIGVNLTQFDLYLQKIVELRKENQQLASLRDFLLPMLMNGQVKVRKES